MASTNTLQGSVNWASSYLRFAPLTIGTGNEPAISAANLVMQTILGPPFCWRWNRAEATLSTIAQDTPKALSTFGFLEEASYTDTTGLTKQIEVRTRLANAAGAGAETGVPQRVAAQLDDNAGNITFRLLPQPDATYTINLIYQKKAPIFAALATTWAPLPDEFSYIYNQGFLAFMLLYWDNPRWAVVLPRFLNSLVGASEGLDETQKAIFLEGFISRARLIQAGSLATQAGNLGRSGLGSR